MTKRTQKCCFSISYIHTFHCGLAKHRSSKRTFPQTKLQNDVNFTCIMIQCIIYFEVAVVSCKYNKYRYNSTVFQPFLFITNENKIIIKFSFLVSSKMHFYSQMRKNPSPD